jgi:hypothetical protein
VLSRITDEVVEYGVAAVQARWMNGPESFGLTEVTTPVRRDSDGRLHAQTVVLAQHLKLKMMLAVYAGGAVVVASQTKQEHDAEVRPRVRGWVIADGVLVEIPETELRSAPENEGTWFPEARVKTYKGIVDPPWTT